MYSEVPNIAPDVAVATATYIVVSLWQGHDRRTFWMKRGI